jgi:hypothetical protein|tara:strand:+ start:306 stop:494 length:189 start_codon:yes stop_codon:yes gene_type:complete
MKNRNKILDLIEITSEELDRLYSRIPEDFNDEANLQLRIIRGIKKQLELIQNFVELEDDGIQ